MFPSPLGGASTASSLWALVLLHNYHWMKGAKSEVVVGSCSVKERSWIVANVASIKKDNTHTHTSKEFNVKRICRLDMYSLSIISHLYVGWQDSNFFDILEYYSFFLILILKDLGMSVCPMSINRMWGYQHDTNMKSTWNVPARRERLSGDQRSVPGVSSFNACAPPKTNSLLPWPRSVGAFPWRGSMWRKVHRVHRLGVSTSFRFAGRAVRPWRSRDGGPTLGTARHSNPQSRRERKERDRGNSLIVTIDSIQMLHQYTSVYYCSCHVLFNTSTIHAIHASTENARLSRCTWSSWFAELDRSSGRGNCNAKKNLVSWFLS